MKIDINNQSGVEVDKKFVRASAMAAFRAKDIKNKELSIAFVDENKIRELNRIYRKLDRATDVLSFESGDGDLLGEIAISPQAVLKRSGEENFEKDLARVLIHGILHLLGYDHNKKKNRGEMREEEEKIILKIIN